MIISDEEILNFIRREYPNHYNYTFPEVEIDAQQEFVVVRDIHEVNEDLIDINKVVFVRGLNRDRQTNSVNIINICDSVNAESYGLDEKLYQELEKHNRTYTKAFLRNGSRWVDLPAFNLCCRKAREVIGNLNPRTLFNISKYTYLLNNNLLNTANVRLSIVNLRSCLELMHLEVRKMNYDMIMRPVTTLESKQGYETIIKTKYINNFSLEKDIHFDHEFHVCGTFAGLVARKNSGVFGNIKVYYYQYDLLNVLTSDFAYLNLDVEVGPGPKAPVFVNGKQIAHKVILKRKRVEGSFSSSSKLTAKLLARYKFQKYSDIFDCSNPLELNQIQEDELLRLIGSGDCIVVYQVDETLFDSYSVYDTVNPQSGVVVEKGEIFNAPYNLIGISYESKKSIRNLWRVWDQLLLISKTNKRNQLERIRLYDSLVLQQKNLIARAEQAERLVKESQEINEKIQELNATLTQKVQERTLQLERANELQKITFVNLVHETRTPLTIANNYLEQYLEKHVMDEELEIVKSAVNKLTKDVTSLFDIERFNRGVDVYRHEQICDFSKLLKESWILFEAYLRKKKLYSNVSIEDGVFIKADPVAVNRIVNNLIDNAIKYSASGDSIAVNLQKSGERVLFSVSDTGPGIPLNQQRKIFEPYYQLNHEKSSLQGMGLGLPIVKKVMESLNGEISIESNPSVMRGTIVTACFDVSSGINTSVSEPQGVANQFFASSNIDIYLPEPSILKSAPVILLLEDNLSMLNYLFNKLKIQYSIYAATNGADALKLLERMEVFPDLIVTDIMMDKMDGYSFAKVLSGNKAFNHIPLIFLTAKNLAADKVKGLELGAIDFIQKPYSYVELRYKIDSIIHKIGQKVKIAKDPSLLISNDNDLFAENCKINNLTSREVDVASLMREGKGTKEIASILNISPRTVSTHISNIYQKLEKSGKLEAIRKLEK